MSQKEQTGSSSGPPTFVIASIIVVVVLILGASAAVIAQKSKKSTKRKGKQRTRKIEQISPAPSTGEYSEAAAQALAPEPTPLPELSGNTVDEDGIEWAQDAAGNWYWREENGQFELYDS